MHATAHLSRRPILSLLAASLLASPLLAGCEAAPPPVVYKPLTFEYLTKLRLDVATVDTDTVWTPGAGGTGGIHVEQLSPEAPVEALRRMAQDRLVPGGNGGHATFVIDDASLTQATDRYEADFAVHMDISSADGTRTGYAEARISRTRTISDYTPEGTRRELYDLVKASMNDMNVEFEFQVRRALKDWLQTTAGAAPEPPPVEQQDLTEPAKP